MPAYENEILPIGKAVAILGKTVNAMHALSHNFKERKGCFPKWYVKRGNHVFIDMHEYTYYSKLQSKVWNYNTEKLYWVFAEHFKVTDTWISQQISRISSKFKSEKSWRTFLNNSMFRLPDEKMVTESYNYQIDFIVHASKLAYHMIKAEKNGTLEELKRRLDEQYRQFKQDYDNAGSHTDLH